MNETKSPTWFAVTRFSNSWALRYRAMGNLHCGQSNWYHDYPTKELAIEAGTKMGWVHVRNWKEARELAKPIEAARWDAHQARREARKFKVTITFTDYATNKKTHVWVAPERAAQILADLGEPNKYGVIE